MIDVDALASSACPYEAHAALRAGGAIRDDRGRWIVARSADVHKVLERLDAHVMAPPTGVPALGNITALMARFIDGERHRIGRAIAVEALEAVDPVSLRDESALSTRIAIELDRDVNVTALARQVTIDVLAAALGFVDPPMVAEATAVMATALAARHDVVPASAQEVTSAIERLRRAAPADDDVTVANLVALLFQATDATAGLVTNALMAAAGVAAGQQHDAERLVSDTARYDPSVQSTRRLATERFDLDGCTVEPGEELVLLLAAANYRVQEGDDLPAMFTFGAGAHACPGRQHALAIAAGIVEVVRTSNRSIDVTAVRYEPRTNLRIADSLTLSNVDVG